MQPWLEKGERKPARDIEPGNVKAWNNRCWDRAVLGRLEEALADCNEGPEKWVTQNTHGSLPC
jgi:hypothetical protein